MSANAVRTWFGGLPVIDRLCLSARDVTRLRRIAIRRRALGWFLIFAFPSLLAVTVMLLLFNGWFMTRMQETETESAVLGLIALAVMAASLVFLLALPVSLIFARESFRRARLARVAMIGGSIVRCRGNVEELILDRSVWKKLDSAGLLDEDEVVLDVVEGPELLWRVGPVEIEPWLEVKRGITTETPEYAWIASRWTRPTDLDQETVHYNQRRLSDEEISELSDCIPRLGARRMAFVTAINALAIWRIYDLVANGVPPLEPLLVTGLALWADIEVGRLWTQRQRFAMDVAEGWVALVRLPEEQEGADDPSISFAEFLPESGAEWTVDGSPAAWRRVVDHHDFRHAN
jgi:hypothetical protein